MTKVKPYIDISAPVSSQLPVWPGDPPNQLERVLDVACGDAATVSRMTIGSHTGTHVDAFSHFDAEAPSLNDMELTPYLGTCLVVAVNPKRDDVIALNADDLEQSTETFLSESHTLTRLLLKTSNSSQPWFEKPFNPRFIHLDTSAAGWLTDHNVQLIGVDYLSVEGYEVKGAPVHHHLMNHRVYILEGLYLQDVDSGWYDLVCLPMALANGDGAPARAILRPIAG